MPIKGEALRKIKEANQRGLPLSEPILKHENVKTLEYILQECKGLGFSASFCEFVKLLHHHILKGSKKPTDEIISNFKQKHIQADNLADLIILMDRILMSDPKKKFIFRFNQLIALCAFLIPMEVSKFIYRVIHNRCTIVMPQNSES